MGATQSSDGKCNYDTYINKIKKMTMRYTTEKIKNQKIETNLRELNIELEKKKGEVTKLKNICLSDETKDIKDTGKKIYNLLSKTYKENLNLLNTQKQLIKKQNELLGDKTILTKDLYNKINKVDDNIVKNDRLLELHGEDASEKKKYNKLFNLFMYFSLYTN